MAISRRQFIRGGVSAFTVSFAAPAFLSDIARAQGARARNLVVVYLSGGNDSLSTVVPYQDPFYYSRRPTIAVPAGQVLQIGTDSSGKALGLHPRLTGCATSSTTAGSRSFSAPAIRTRAVRTSRASTSGARPVPRSPVGEGWLGRYLETVPADPLAGWSATQELPRALLSREVSVPAIPNAPPTRSTAPTRGAEAANERAAATRIASHLPAERPQPGVREHAARRRRSRRSTGWRSVVSYTGTVAYPNNGFALALRTVAGAIVRDVGTRVFWVQTGGFDTHAAAGRRPAPAATPT